MAVLAITAACGGDGGGDDAAKGDTATTTAGSETTVGTVATKTDGATIKGASIRLVNAFAPDGTGAPIVIYPTYDAKTGDKPVLTIPFGEVSNFFEPPAVNGKSVFSIYATGTPSRDTRLTPVEQTFVPGDRATVLLSAIKSSEGKVQGSTLVLFEKGAEGRNTLPPAVPAKAIVPANATALEKAGYTVGRVGSGCLKPRFSASLGGTSVLEFELDPGAMEIGAYSINDSRCNGTPAVPPVPVPAQAGTRHLLFAVPSAAGPRFLVLNAGS